MLVLPRIHTTIRVSVIQQCPNNIYLKVQQHRNQRDNAVHVLLQQNGLLLLLIFITHATASTGYCLALLVGNSCCRYKQRRRQNYTTFAATAGEYHHVSYVQLTAELASLFLHFLIYTYNSYQQQPPNSITVGPCLLGRHFNDLILKVFWFMIPPSISHECRVYVTWCNGWLK